MKCKAKSQDFFSKFVLMSTTWLDARGNKIT